jgi:hypothetical protein
VQLAPSWKENRGDPLLFRKPTGQRAVIIRDTSPRYRGKAGDSRRIKADDRIEEPDSCEFSSQFLLP